MEFPSALGGERSFLSVANELRDQFSFTFLAPAHGDLEKLIGVLDFPQIEFSLRDEVGVRRDDADAICELTQLLSEHQFEILHTNSLTLSRFLGRNLMQISMPVVGHIRDMMKLSKGSISDLGRLSRLICVSDATRNYYELMGVNSDRLLTIHNGIDVEQFPRKFAKSLHEELGCAPEAKFAATIGQIGLRKGHSTLIAALPEMARNCPDWHFLMIGECYSGKQESREYLEDLQCSVAQNGFSDRVHWLGYREDIPELLPQIDLLIHPARQEPFGRVLLEAAACGVAIVATDVGGTSEMLVDQDSALLITVDDPEGLAQTCISLMLNSSARKLLGEQARQRVRSHFALNSSAKSHARVWKELLNKIP
ncbi:glycosyltransferase family 4 protein [Rubinisphaera italica]|nr:glycosyltransferase family 4 protein [Rubinisphaera italica]